MQLQGAGRVLKSESLITSNKIRQFVPIFLESIGGNFFYPLYVDFLCYFLSTIIHASYEYFNPEIQSRNIFSKA